MGQLKQRNSSFIFLLLLLVSLIKEEEKNAMQIDYYDPMLVITFFAKH